MTRILYIAHSFDEQEKAMEAQKTLLEYFGKRMVYNVGDKSPIIGFCLDLDDSDKNVIKNVCEDNGVTGILFENAAEFVNNYFINVTSVKDEE